MPQTRHSLSFERELEHDTSSNGLADEAALRAIYRSLHCSNSMNTSVSHNNNNSGQITHYSAEENKSGSQSELLEASRLQQQSSPSSSPIKHSALSPSSSANAVTYEIRNILLIEREIVSLSAAISGTPKESKSWHVLKKRLDVAYEELDAVYQDVEMPSEEVSLGSGGSSKKKLQYGSAEEGETNCMAIVPVPNVATAPNNDHKITIESPHSKAGDDTVSNPSTKSPSVEHEVWIHCTKTEDNNSLVDSCITFDDDHYWGVRGHSKPDPEGSTKYLTAPLVSITEEYGESVLLENDNTLMIDNGTMNNNEGTQQAVANRTESGRSLPGKKLFRQMGATFFKRK